MDLFSLTRRLVDIDSTTGAEKHIGEYLFACLAEMAARYQGHAERMDVKQDRFNVFAHWGEPLVTLSTHMDTVPPFIPSREDDDRIWGRGTCDAKGIIAAMIHTAEGLLAEGTRNIGLLFVVGEERNSAGAKAAARNPRGSRFLINGEPTENRLALGAKGALRYEIAATGKAAHSAYPELGESAIEKLLDALQRVRGISLPVNPVLGRSTLNIGTITGGRAPNVIPDAACAEIMFRLVEDPEPLRAAVLGACEGRATAREVLCIPAVQLGFVEGVETTVVAYTSDIPEFKGVWGTPYLLGPGSIDVAHTEAEYVGKQQLAAAVPLYQRLVKRLITAS